jgi:hypothetical protein
VRTQLNPIDAVQIIDSLAADLTVAVEVWRETRWHLWPKGSEKTEIVVDRVLVSSVILSLAKYLEFYRMYQSIFPSQSEAATHAEKIHDGLSASSIQKFRDKYVGHIWDRAEKGPLRESEVQNILKEVMGDDRAAFIEWVHNESGNQFPESVVSVLAKLRDELTKSHGINPDDIYSR